MPEPTPHDREPEPGSDVSRLLAGGALLLLLCALGNFGIKDDSCAYIAYAKALSVGRLTEVHLQDYPPLYPLLIALAKPLVGDWNHAARAVSWLTTLLAVWPVYLLSREALGRQAAWWAGWLYLTHPLIVEWGGTAMSDGPFLLAYAAAILTMIRAARDGALADYILCGFWTGAAFLVRPEGLQVAALLGVFALAWRGLRAIPGLLVFGVVCALIGGPYVALISHHHGYVLLSKKKRIFHLPWLKLGPPQRPVLRAPLPEDHRPPAPLVDRSAEENRKLYDHEFRRRWLDAEALAFEYERQARAWPERSLIPPSCQNILEPDLSRGWPDPVPGQVVYFNHLTDPAPIGAGGGGSALLARGKQLFGGAKEFAEKYHPLASAALLLAALIGLGGLRRRAWPTGAQAALLLAFALHGALVLTNLLKYGYLSERHLLPLLVVGLGWVSAVLLGCDQRLEASWAAARGWWGWIGGALAPAREALQRRGLGPLLAITLCVFLADSLRPRGWDKLYLQQLPAVVAAQDATGLANNAVVGREPRLAHFGGGRYLRLDPWRGYREVVRQLVQAQADLIIVPTDALYRFDPLLKLGWIERVIAVEIDQPPGKAVHCFRVTRLTPIAR